MLTSELHTEIIRKILNIENIDILKSIKRKIKISISENYYTLSEEEKEILEERQKNKSQLYSNENVFEEIDSLLV